MSENMIFCQSCAMPITEPAQWGTELDGTPSADYCHYCYQKGAFTNPTESMTQMIETCLPFTCQATGRDAAQVRAEMEQYFPQLKRWKQD